MKPGNGRVCVRFHRYLLVNNELAGERSAKKYTRRKKTVGGDNRWPDARKCGFTSTDAKRAAENPLTALRRQWLK
jgi:hypothetical protein